MPLTLNHGTAISRPATDGPMIRLALRPALFRAMALARSSRLTRLGIQDWRAGMLIDTHAPWMTPETTRCQYWIRPRPMSVPAPSLTFVPPRYRAWGCSASARGGPARWCRDG